jgi:hypothetical protein
MKNSASILFILIGIIISSCNKGSDKLFIKDATSKYDIEAMVEVSTSEYEKVEIEKIERDGDNGACLKGAFEFFENGESIGKVFFKGNKKAEIEKKDIKKDYHCEKKGAKEEYSKIVVDPIVKLKACDYIVAGTVEYFDAQGNWSATVDYGNGICDDLATKTTPEGVYTFSLNDWK